MKLASIAERKQFRKCKAASKWAQWNLFQLPNGSRFAFVKCKNAKTQSFNCNTLIFNDIRFCIFVKSCKNTPKKAPKRAFSVAKSSLLKHKTHLFGWVFVLVHQVFDVDSHAEDGAGVDKYLAEEHQHRAVYLACGRKCQWDGAHGCAEGQKKNGACAFHGSDHCAACHASKKGEKGFEQGFKKFA